MVMSRRELLQSRLNEYYKAEHDVKIHGQTVEVEGMRITRASLTDLRKEIRNLETELEELEKTMERPRRRIRAVVPL